MARRRAEGKAPRIQRNEIVSKPLKTKEAAKASVSRAKLFQGLSGLGRNPPFRSAKDCGSFSAPNVAQGAPEQIGRNPKSCIGQHLKPAPARKGAKARPSAAE
jgi:hypothetical protein